MEQLPSVNIFTLNDDILVLITDELWGKDLCSLSATCLTMYETCKERLHSCKTAEMCVRKIRRRYAPLNRTTMETYGLIRFTRNTWNLETASADVKAYNRSPHYYRDSLKSDFLTTYTTEMYTKLHLTTYSVIDRLLIPYVEAREGFHTS